MRGYRLQAGQSALSMPRRTAIGLDHNRASVLVAGLEKKMGITLYNEDIFLNIAGGVRLNEPGGDLGVVTANVSSKLDRPVPSHTAVCGEVGLTGEVRAVSQIAVRIKEAERLGFSTCLVPQNNLKNMSLQGKINVIGITTVGDALNQVLARLKVDEAEIVTLYYGADTKPDEAEQVSAAIRQQHPQLQVEVVRGGQPHYNYIGSVE